MFCRNCGKEMADGSQFCPSCGARPSESSAAVRPRTDISGSLIDVLVTIAASILSVVSIVFLVGSLSLGSRLNGTVDWIIKTAGTFGLNIASVPNAAPFIQYARTGMSALGRSAVFVGIGLFSILLLIGLSGFVVVAIHRELRSIAKSMSS